MNDAELDMLIAAAATVSDAEVSAWHLAGPEAHLREEIMSTTDAPAAGTAPDPDRASATAVDADDVVAPPTGTTVIDLHREPGPGRQRPRRRTLALVAAAAITVIAVGAATIAADGPEPEQVADLGSGQGAAGPPSAGAGNADRHPAAAPEDVAALAGVPTLAPEGDGWAIVFVEALTAQEGDMTVADLRGTDGVDTTGTGDAAPAGGAGRLSIRWAPADLYAEWVADAERGVGAGAATTVAGQPAVTFDYGPPEPPTGPGATPDTPAGESGEAAGAEAGVEASSGAYHATFVVIGDHAVEAAGQFPSQEAYEAAVASLREVPAETWATLIPANSVLPSQTAAAVDDILADVPLPTGFDVEPLRSATGIVRDRYHVGADATGAVACAWIDSWVAARAAGDTASAQLAVDAMATAHEWDILVEMEPGGGWSSVVWEYADALPTDAPVSGGRPLTIAESYEEALGC